MNIQPFNFNGNQLSVIINENNDPLFVAKEVTEILGYRTANDAIKYLDSDEKDTIKYRTPGGEQNVSIITESGLYSLILRSKKEEAKAFKKWVTSEVLPSIRKHGAYMTPSKIEEVLMNPDTIIQLANNLKAEQQKVKELTKTVNKQQHYVHFVEKCFDQDEKIDVGQAAKILELSYGRNTLFKKLREMGIFFQSKNEPKQEYINRGYFLLKQKWIERNNHDSFCITKVLVTQRGLAYLSAKLKGADSSIPKLQSIN